LETGFLHPPTDQTSTLYRAAVSFVLEAALQFGNEFVTDSERGLGNWETAFAFGKSGASILSGSEREDAIPDFFYRISPSGAYALHPAEMANLRAILRSLWSGCKSWNENSLLWQGWIKGLTDDRNYSRELSKAVLTGQMLLAFRQARHEKKFARAEDQLRLAIGTWPELSTGREWELWFKAVRGKTEEALIGLDKLPGLFGDEALRRAIHALCMLQSGHAEHAFSILESSPAVDPFHRELNLVAARTLVALRRKDEAFMIMQSRVLPCVLLPELAYDTLEQLSE
jgi:hypothetical protein